MIRPGVLLLGALVLAASAAGQEQPYAVDDPRIEPPVRVGGEPPAYTPEAKVRCYEGTVRLEAIVDVDGTVLEATITEDQHFGLGAAAREAVVSWTYEPARLVETGAPVAVVQPVTVEFSSPCTESDPPSSLLLRVGHEVKEPQKISAPPPEYTFPARRACIQGLVILEAVISQAGDVRSVRILKDLPLGLGDAAAEAVRKWRFEPVRLPDGEAVEVIYTLTVNFQLPKCVGQKDVIEMKTIEAPRPEVGGLTGQVVAKMRVNKRGRVTKVKVVSTTNEALIEPVKESLRRWIWEPPRKPSGAKATGEVTVNLEF